MIFKLAIVLLDHCCLSHVLCGFNNKVLTMHRTHNKGIFVSFPDFRGGVYDILMIADRIMNHAAWSIMISVNTNVFIMGL